MRIIRIIAVFLLCSCFLASPSAYSQSKNNDNVINSLLKDLEKAIENADKRMIAHPTFLDELRKLVGEYKKKLRNVFFFDDFSDGDYTKNPAWKIRQGQFSITSDGKLQSIVELDLPPASSPSSSKEVSLDDLFQSVFGDIVQEEEVEGDAKKTAKVENAEIESLAQIGPAFEVDLSFVTKVTATNDAMEIILLGGNKNRRLYQLTYPVSSEEARKISILRVAKANHKRLIKTEFLPPITDPDQPHILQWIRDKEGTMEVLVDGKRILSTKEQYHQDGFTGIRLVNSGGIYKWGPIQILEPQVKE